MDAFVLQLLNGLDKGGAYALIALGLTLIFGTLGVVNFAHGALFMLGAFCAVGMQKLLTLSKQVKDPSITFFDSYTDVPYLKIWFGDAGLRVIDYAVPLSILLAIPVMLLIGVAMERGLIRHFYRRPHADQILVTFGLAIVLQEIVKAYFGANPIPTPAPEIVRGQRQRRRLARPRQLGGLSVVAAGLFRLLGAGHRHRVRLPAVHHLRHGRARRHARPRDGRPARHQHRAPLHRSCSASRRSSPASPAPCTRRSCRPTTTWAWISWCCRSWSWWSAAWARCRGAVAAGFLLGILQSFASMNEIKAAGARHRPDHHLPGRRGRSCWCGRAACSAARA